MRTIGIMACGHDAGTGRIRSRRGGLLRSVIEVLEGRDLPSGMAPLRGAPIEVPGAYQGIAEVAPATATIQPNRFAWTRAGGSGPDDQSRSARTGNAPAAPYDAANDPPLAGAIKRPDVQNGAVKQIAAPVDVVERHTDSALDNVAGAPQAVAQETAAGLGDGAVADSAGASAVVGWASGAAMPVVMMSLAGLPGSAVGFDARAGASAAEIRPPMTVGNAFTELARETAPRDARTAPLDVGIPLEGADAASGRHGPAWADLLEGPLRPDWEAVDGELRRFLSGLGGLAAQTDELGARPMWALWIGAATALVVACRVSYGRGPLLARPVPGTLGASRRRPVPVGPWPLGPT